MFIYGIIIFFIFLNLYSYFIILNYSFYFYFFLSFIGYCIDLLGFCCLFDFLDFFIVYCFGFLSSIFFTGVRYVLTLVEIV